MENKNICSLENKSPQQYFSNQIKEFANGLDNGWVKERLDQIDKYYSVEVHSLDEYRIERIKEKNESIRKAKELYGDSFEEETDLNTLPKKNILNSLQVVFTNATASCYECTDVKDKKIVLSCEVSTDGWGDYFQMWQTAKYLEEKIPQTLISATTHLNRLPPPLSQISEKINNLVITSSDSKEESKNKVDTALKEADLIINIPHGHVANPNKKPILRVEEYGFNPSENFALGLHVQSPNYLGISLKKTSQAKSIEELVHQPLKNYLVEKNRPFFLGYMGKDHGKDEQHRAGFILAAAASQADQKGDFDIICPLEEMNSLDIGLLASLDIGRVVFMKADKEGELQETGAVKVKSEGKEIHILNPFPVANDDWMTLLKFCEPLVGCTGDMSFSEVISNKKIPFYQIRWHKIEFFTQLLQLTGYVYKEEFKQFHGFLTLVRNSLKENQEENISESCRDLGQRVNKELIVECQKFAEKIHDYYCANDILTSRVKRELAYTQDPQLKIFEKDMFEKWKGKEITLTEACKMLTEKINKK